MSDEKPLPCRLCKSENSGEYGACHNEACVMFEIDPMPLSIWNPLMAPLSPSREDLAKARATSDSWERQRKRARDLALSMADRKTVSGTLKRNPEFGYFQVIEEAIAIREHLMLVALGSIKNVTAAFHLEKASHSSALGVLLVRAEGALLSLLAPLCVSLDALTSPPSKSEAEIRAEVWEEAALYAEKQALRGLLVYAGDFSAKAKALRAGEVRT